MAEEFDVVISGYGPTGLVAASLLSRRGHRVCVFERWPSLYGQPRMATIDGESGRIIQAACNVDAAFRNSLPRRRYVLATGSGKVLIENQWDREHICGFPFRISLHQPDIEDAMDAAARSQGAEINQGWEVVGLAQSRDSVSVTARQRMLRPNQSPEWGPERSVRARYLIGADGARSAVREALGIERRQWPFRNAWLSFDSVRKRKLPDIFGLSPDAQVAVIFCVSDGPAHSIIPLGRQHVRFNLEVDPDANHDDKLNDEFGYRFIREYYGLTADDVEIYRSAVYPFEGKLVNTWRVGRVLLAGDAAHLMTPFLGEGGCSALRDAINLAWKLDLVLRGVASESLLDTYEAERKPHVSVHIEASDKVASMVFAKDADAVAARDRALRDEKGSSIAHSPEIASGILHLDHGHREQPVGSLGPQGVVRRDGREGRFDDLFGWGFQLIGWRYDPAVLLDGGQRKFLEQARGVTAGVTDQLEDGLALDVGGTYEQFFRGHGIEAFLLRPDFTVFGAARTREQVPTLVKSLKTQLNG